MALLTVDGRAEAIVAAAQRFEIDHITNPDARQIGMSFGRLAQELILRIRRDDKGLVEALEALLLAREEAMVAIAPEPRKEQTRQAAGGKPRPAAPARTRKTAQTVNGG